MVLFLFLFVGVVFCSPRFFSTPIVNRHLLEFNLDADFRGCFTSHCIYVSASPLLFGDLPLGPSSAPLFALGEPNGVRFSSAVPADTSVLNFFVPVPRNSIRPAHFDASPFRRSSQDPAVALLVASLSEIRVRHTVEKLSSFHTRVAVSADAVAASNYLLESITSLGCSRPRLEWFDQRYSPNVLCEISGLEPGLPRVVVGAHYDSRAAGVTNVTQRAPGADDNASGSAAVLELLTTVQQLSASHGTRFRRSITFAFFSAEEQGLHGSKAVAEAFLTAGVEVAAMINMDMIGYPQTNHPETIFWMSGDATSNLTSLAFELTQMYLGSAQKVALTPACCSDQASFYARGYPSASVFEALSGNNNPNYHKASDLPATITFSHLMKNAQSAAALVATIAEPGK